MASDGISGYGTTLSGATTGSIGNVNSVSLASVSVDDIEITSSGSTNSWKEYVPGLKDAGEISVDLTFEEDQADVILTRIGSAAELWTFTMPSSGAIFTCNGYMKEQGVVSPIDDKVSSTLTIKLTGEPASKWQGS